MFREKKDEERKTPVSEEKGEKGIHRGKKDLKCIKNFWRDIRSEFLCQPMRQQIGVKVRHLMWRIPLLRAQHTLKRDIIQQK